MNIIDLIKSPKKVLIDWFLKDQMGGLLKAINGYKTWVGVIIFAFTLYQMGSGTPSLMINIILEQMHSIYGPAPLSEMELQLLILCFEDFLPRFFL